MRYLLDTNTCIAFINGMNSVVRARLEAHLFADIAVSAVVAAELYYGAAKSQKPVENRELQEAFLAHFECLDFTEDAAKIYATVRHHLEKAGTPIGANDLMIAAIALANDLTLVTDNVREFSRVDGLRL